MHICAHQHRKKNQTESQDGWNKQAANNNNNNKKLHLSAWELNTNDMDETKWNKWNPKFTLLARISCRWDGFLSYFILLAMTCRKAIKLPTLVSYLSKLHTESETAHSTQIHSVQIRIGRIERRMGWPEYKKKVAFIYIFFFVIKRSGSLTRPAHIGRFISFAV